MEMRVRGGNPLLEPSELCILGIYEGEGLPSSIAGLLEVDDFKGKLEETMLLYPRGVVSPRRLLLVGLGKPDAITGDSVRRAAATAIKRAQSLRMSEVAVGVLGGTGAVAADLAAQAFVEGAQLSAYRFWSYRTGLTDDQTFAVNNVTIFTQDDEAEAAVARGVATGGAVAAGVLTARALVNTPGYAKTPPALAAEAQAVGEAHGFSVTVLDENELVAQGFGGILAVGQGSDAPPRFIIMEHGAAEADKPTICLVGKGITFDSGGLSLKPADAMETMKNDMGGAAAVIGAMQVVADLNLPLHVVGLVAAAENMPSGAAFRPGDIVKTLSGKTIEVLNTDAEGRIVLSDALFFAQRYNPAAIVELSTLTGAVIIALGANTIGMMATDQPLADKIYAAAEATGERVWQLPLWQEYFDQIKSEYADVKNIGGRPAGSITAGAFLANFTGDYPFVHLDIAGAAYNDRPTKSYDSPGGTGVGVRLLTQFLLGYTE
jgi:leucyl aminopeptidase